MPDDLEKAREHVRELAAEYKDRGDPLGFFDALYKEAAENRAIIPWADLEPNKFFRVWAEKTKLKGDGRNALVVGCGLGDDARYLHDLGFKVTAFDIAPTAIEWAKTLHADTHIELVTVDLLHSPTKWNAAFDLVLEIYTIQPLPMEMRGAVIDAIASFVKENGHLIVVTRGRDDDQEPIQMPWPLSPRDLARFEQAGLVQTDFVEMMGDEDEPVRRFVVEYERRP
jgi:2-polyprenyl-3-methyl-5-hydroxy-6-metoxy-1,4-benzoquinol methylase